MKPGDRRHAASWIEPTPEAVKCPAQITVEDDGVVAGEAASREPQGKEDRIEACPLRPNEAVARHEIDLMSFCLKASCLVRERPIHGGLDVRWGMRRKQDPEAHCAASSNTCRSRRTCSSKVNSFAIRSAPRQRRSYVSGVCSATTIASARPCTVGGLPEARTPFVPDLNQSEIPPTSNATVGSLCRPASSPTSASGSGQRLGRTRRFEE